MNRPTEYCAFKKILFERKGVHGNEKIKILNESLEVAFDDLSEDDQKIITRNRYLLDRIRGLGRIGALELLAAVGDALNGLEA